MIHAHGLQKDFGAREVLTDISFELPGSGIHALLGRNGVGKSTLLALIAGQLKPPVASSPSSESNPSTEPA